MIEFIKAHSTSIVLIVIFSSISFVFGCMIDADEKGVYISANYPSGSQIFMLGKESSNIRDMDLNSLGEIDSNVMITKLKSLKVDSLIGDGLRKMVTDAKGPFILVNVKLNLHLMSDLDVNGPVAKACSNSPVFKKPIIAINIIGNQDFKITAPLDIHPFSKEIVSCEGNENDIWISKEHVKNWAALDKVDDADDVIVVDAQIIISNRLS